jgi:uncharacterized protein involved in exopolysaccharide biosynthesis
LASVRLMDSRTVYDRPYDGLSNTKLGGAQSFRGIITRSHMLQRELRPSAPVPASKISVRRHLNATRAREMDDGPESTFTLRGLLAAIRANWMFLAGSATVALAAGTAVAYLSTPIYRAEIVVLPVPDQENRGALAGVVDQLGSLSALAGLTIGGNRSQAQGMAILQSRALVGELIRDENLLPVLYPDLWDSANNRWRSADPRRQPTPFKAQESFLRNVLRVSEDRLTGLVTVRVEWKDPRQAAQWASELVARANTASQRKALQEAQSSIAYLQRRLESTDAVELRQAIYRLMEAQLKQIVVASSRQEYAFRVIDPAQVPDVDRFVRPQRALLLVLSPTVGFIMGLFVVLWRRGSRKTDGEVESGSK